jgi:hypothetical protein
MSDSSLITYQNILDREPTPAFFDSIEIDQLSKEVVELLTQLEQQAGRHATPEFTSKVAQAKARNQGQPTVPNTAKRTLPAPKGADEWKEF